MKIEKYLLSILCLGACIWSARMVFGVTGLAQYQGPPALIGSLELAMFVGAGLLPLLLVWNASAAKYKALILVWAVCTCYVVLLALNLARVGLMTSAAVRIALWTAIAVLLIRALRRSTQHGAAQTAANE